jgi:ferric-dicitrate binding protein FerR (iron transport regulator)
MSEIEYIISIIAKQLKEQASPEELQELQSWLQADALHQRQYDELMAIWQNSGRLLNAPGFDTHSAWLKIKNQIKRPPATETKPSSPVISLIFLKRAAIAVVLLAAISLATFWYVSRTQWQTFTATVNNQVLHLPDQSIVHVRKGSAIRFPKKFSARERQVELTGEAFFEVQHNEQQPFRIVTAHSAIRVLGTSFLVHTNEMSDEVVVVTGQVQVQDKNRNSNQVIVPAGQRVVLQQHQFTQQPVTDSNFIAWQTGHLNFENTPLYKVLEDVAHYYGETIELAPGVPPSAASHGMTLRFDNQPLEQALEEIRLISGLALKKENGKIVFYQK